MKLKVILLLIIAAAGISWFGNEIYHRNTFERDNYIPDTISTEAQKNLADL